MISMLLMAAISAVDFNAGWQWRPDATNAAWRAVDLPHDAMMEAPWQREADHSQRVFKPLGAALYRKTFAYDPLWKDRNVILDFDGLSFFGDVWVNGAKVASTEYGWVGFEADMTPYLRTNAENVVEVRTEARGGKRGCRWYTGCGLCRAVTLKTNGKRRIARHGLHVVTRENRYLDLSVDVEGFTGLTNNVKISAEIAGHGFYRNVTARIPKGNNQSRITVPFETIEIPNAALWSVETPNLYDVRVTLYADTECCRFGFRTIEYGKDFGFKLNGEKIFLKGMANHADWGALGAAAYKDAIRRQFRRMKEFGYNTVRCSHNPYPKAFYDLADEMGLLVVDEFTDKWGDCWAGRKSLLETWPDLMSEWLRANRNHPAIILWSLGNELQHEELPAGYRTDDWGVTTFRMMDVLAKRWDATRPTTVAMYPARAGGLVSRKDPRFYQEAYMRAPELARITAVSSFNYRCDEYGTYLKHDPNMIVFQSEASTSRYLEPLFCMDERKMVGLCYWGAIEYWGESNAWPKKGWNFSFFSHALTPYPTAYLIRSGFERNRPICHLGVLEKSESLVWNDVKSGTKRMTENWNRAAGATNDVYVFSNAAEVELFLEPFAKPREGRALSRPLSLGKRTPVNHVAVYTNVAWQAGELKAVDANGAQHAIRTSGPAADLRLTVEPGTEMLKYVWIESVDAQGRVVPTANAEIAVDVSGQGHLLALDDDDQYTEQLFNVSKKRQQNGRLLAIVRLDHPHAPAMLTANGKTLALGGPRVIGEGETLVIPRGIWPIAPIEMKSRSALVLQDGAELVFSDDVRAYEPKIRATFEGVECDDLHPLVYAYGATNVSISGRGTFRSARRSWTWNEYCRGRKGEIRLDQRMQFFQFNRCRDVRFTDFHVVNSPRWTLHFYRCEDVVARGLDLFAKGQNTDGFDIEMTRNVLIENCTIDQGDDGFTIKSGKDMDARLKGVPTENVEIRNCHVRSAHGILVIGSEISAGVRNIHLHDCTADSVINGCYIKSNPFRGGFVENILFENVTCSNAHHSAFAIETDVTYGIPAPKGCTEEITRIRDITVRNAAFQKATWRLKIEGDARKPVEGVKVENMTVNYVRKGKNGNIVKNAKGVIDTP